MKKDFYSDKKLSWTTAYSLASLALIIYHYFVVDYSEKFNQLGQEISQKDVFFSIYLNFFFLFTALFLSIVVLYRSYKYRKIWVDQLKLIRIAISLPAIIIWIYLVFGIFTT
jgi:hypothetical protein